MDNCFSTITLVFFLMTWRRRVFPLLTSHLRCSYTATVWPGGPARRRRVSAERDLSRQVVEKKLYIARQYRLRHTTANTEVARHIRAPLLCSRCEAEWYWPIMREQTRKQERQTRILAIHGPIIMCLSLYFVSVFALWPACLFPGRERITIER